MVRVAGLQEQLDTNPMFVAGGAHTGNTTETYFGAAELPLLNLQTRCLLKEILPGLRELGIRIVEYEDLTENQKQELSRFFMARVFPVLTPLAVDPGHPFPYISNISLNLWHPLVPRRPN